MSSVMYTILWLVFLLVHLDIEITHSALLTIKACPARYSSECPPEPVDRCSNDHDCEARYPGQGFKCCNDCGTQCMVPAIKAAPSFAPNAAKMVTKCPTSPPSREFPPGPDQECQNDTICNGKYPGQGLKCCRDGCNFRCIPPVLKPDTQTYEVQGTCPVSETECSRRADDECHDDSTCRELYPGLELKCCKDGCDFRCVLPNPVIGTITPQSESHMKQKKNAAKLVAKCPTSPPSREFPPGPDQECQNDTICHAKYPRQDLKCCRDGCDFRCIPPVMKPDTQTYEVQGTCPVSETVECSRQADDECHDDSTCRELYPGLELKCCKDGCDFRCVLPIPVIGTIAAQSDNRTKQRTTLSPKPEIFECPIFPPVAGCPPEPYHECNDDQKCEQLHPGLELKCCEDGCDRRYVPPLPVIQTNPGVSNAGPHSTLSLLLKIFQCPVFAPVAECARESEDECNDDQICTELHPGLGLVCCIDGCNRKCVPPILKRDESKSIQQTNRD